MFCLFPLSANADPQGFCSRGIFCFLFLLQKKGNAQLRMRAKAIERNINSASTKKSFDPNTMILINLSESKTYKIKYAYEKINTQPS
jgi:hypothetical protein